MKYATIAHSVKRVHDSTMGQDRIAFIDGVRTPFAKQSGALRHLLPLELGALTVRELLRRQPVAIDRVVFGQVLPTVAAPNIAREVVIAADLPRTTDAFSVSRACATSHQAVVALAESIRSGAVQSGVAGGADSSSILPVGVSRKLAATLLGLSKAKSLADKLRLLASISVQDLKPVAPGIAEYSTGLTMGQSAEQMAKENGISRERQDTLAHASHSRATAAEARGFFSTHVIRIQDAQTDVATDSWLRRDSELARYAKLAPVFDRKAGTVTAGNSSPLTDGAAALLMMREDVAKAQGLRPLGYLRSSAFAAIDPRGQLLMGPAYAIPKALAAAQLDLSAIDIIDMHEAFAAQVLSNVDALGSDRFAQTELGLRQKVGEVDPDKLNTTGGSIALGHPFAATGARQILQTLHSMRDNNVRYGLVSACAAGGLGAALVLERDA